MEKLNKEELEEIVGKFPTIEEKQKQLEELTKNINPDDLPDMVGYISINSDAFPVGTKHGDWVVEVEDINFNNKVSIVSANDREGWYEISVRQVTSLDGSPYEFNRIFHRKGKVKIKYIGSLAVYDKYR